MAIDWKKVADYWAAQNQSIETGYAEGDDGDDLGFVDFDDTGAVKTKPKIKLSPAMMQNAGRMIASINQMAQQKQSAPLLAVANFGKSMKALAVKAATGAGADSRARTAFYNAQRPTFGMTACVDALAATTLSGAITFNAPHGQPWRVCGILINSGAAGVAAPIRFTSITIAGVEQLRTGAVTFASGAPTNPGLSSSIWDARRGIPGPQRAAKEDLSFWVLDNRGAVLDPQQTVQMIVYNPHSSAQSCEITLLVQSNPCDSPTADMFAKRGVLLPGTDGWKKWIGQRKIMFG